MNTDEHGSRNREVGPTREAPDRSNDQFAWTQQPEGLPRISRGLSVTISPEPRAHFSCTLEGCQKQSHNMPGSSAFPGLWHPFRVRETYLSGYRGCRRCAPQPPAKICESFGLVTVRR